MNIFNNMVIQVWFFKKKSVLVLSFFLLFFTYKLQATDPFLPYLTERAPLIIRELGESVQDGVKTREMVFLSRVYEDIQGIDSVLTYAIVARPGKGGKYPGLLLLHGGGGCAEVEKARRWAALGYVVLSLDEPGVANPEKTPHSKGRWKNVEYGENRFIALPDITHSTIFDAVLSSLQGLYLLREQPDVIRDKIGITGISWGGYLTTMVSGLANSMIAASFSVYGCGFYDKGTVFMKMLLNMQPEERLVWLNYLDAGRRMREVKTPFFIAAATNDNWFYPPAVMETLNAAQGYTNHLFAANANHQIPLPGGTGENQKTGWLKMEQTFFDYYLKDMGDGLPVITDIKHEIIKKKDTVFLKIRFKVKSSIPVAKAHINFSNRDQDWTKRKWNEIPASSKRKNRFEAIIPLEEKTDWFITISDTRPVTVSSIIISYL